MTIKTILPDGSEQRKESTESFLAYQARIKLEAGKAASESLCAPAPSVTEPTLPASKKKVSSGLSTEPLASGLSNQI